MKPFWLSAVEMSQEPVQALMSGLKPYGLALKGHFWKNDLKNMAWTDVMEGVNDPQIAFWSILISKEALENPDIRYGLSISAIAVRARRGTKFPIILIQSNEPLISQERLPTPLQGAKRLVASDPGLPAKLVAAAHMPGQMDILPYHMDVHADPQVGQWFEVRPVQEIWPGIIFGVSGAQITFQAVGPEGGLPEKSVLNYPMEGMKLAVGDREYTAWAVQNPLDHQTAYFVKVNGHPPSILFGPYSRDDAADLFVMTLK